MVVAESVARASRAAPQAGCYTKAGSWLSICCFCCASRTTSCAFHATCTSCTRLWASIGTRASCQQRHQTQVFCSLQHHWHTPMSARIHGSRPRLILYGKQRQRLNECPQLVPWPRSLLQAQLPGTLACLLGVSTGAWLHHAHQHVPSSLFQHVVASCTPMQQMVCSRNRHRWRWLCWRKG